MAKTSFSTSDALTKKLWEEQLFRDTIKASYFSKFMGSTSDNPVTVNEKLTKDQGDTVTFGIRFRLTNAGVADGEALEGQETKLNTSSFALTLVERANAVRDRGPLDRQRAMFSIDEEAQIGIQDWMTEYIDAQCFNALSTSTSNKYWVNGYSADTSVTASDLLTLKELSKLKAGAITGWNRKQTPIRPVMVDGVKCFIFLTHPDALFDLYESAQFQQAMREAEVRGKDNPLFLGAKAFYNGIIIHEHENIPIYTNFGASANVAGVKSAFIGQQALCWAWGKRPRIVPVEFDYEREHGFGMSIIYAVGKPKFTYNGTARDYGYAELHSARTSISDA